MSISKDPNSLGSRNATRDNPADVYTTPYFTGGNHSSGNLANFPQKRTLAGARVEKDTSSQQTTQVALKRMAVGVRK
jgi:hypothetical protein